MKAGDKIKFVDRIEDLGGLADSEYPAVLCARVGDPGVTVEPRLNGAALVKNTRTGHEFIAFKDEFKLIEESNATSEASTNGGR